ncbi:hypothetical protein CC1G_07932 [Coprinopsis cinerea okayama7|uniref:Uncharacterized protein n=1 Tax=Coprinopsis cinerea (strain Okayama-7 / 130 / ATCC MYA-4618 / FGSC 9003) TaxID=240176 RepID=A8P6S4_COPC7|nr:hypothetical protein CC1G_07932 [Coprinopsis cinerea okayama7\|eukprot:XP_001839217.2 hypothetical protein CC1G_07932 [Coprinopsis cinerea okayama7\
MGALPPSDPILNNIITQNLHYWQIAATTRANQEGKRSFNTGSRDRINLGTPVNRHSPEEYLYSYLPHPQKKKFSTVQILYLLNRYSGDALFIHGVWYQLWLRGEAFQKVYQLRWFRVGSAWSAFGPCKNLVHVSPLEAGSDLARVHLPGPGDNILDNHRPRQKRKRRGMSVCVPGFAKPFLEWYWAYLVFIIAFDVVAFTLALMEGIRYFRRTKLAEGSLVRILLRDSIFFPFLGLSVSIFALLAWRSVLPYPSVAVLMTLMALTSPILGSRLILNLRDAYYKPFAEEVNPGAGPSHRQLSSGPTIRTPIEIQRSVEVSRSHIDDVQLQIFPIRKV